MRKLLSAIASVLMLTVLMTPLPASSTALRQILVVSGPIQVDADVYPGLGNQWNFNVTNMASFQPGDWVEFRLTDSSGRELASDFEYLSYLGPAQASIRFSLTLFNLSRTEINGGLFVEIEIEPFDYKAQVGNYKVLLPTSVFPPAPGSDKDYVKFSNNQYVFEKKTSCGAQAVSLEINDPYNEVSSVVVQLMSMNGQLIEEDNVFIDRELGINFASLFLCPQDFEDFSGAQTLTLQVTWTSPQKAPTTITTKAELSPFSDAARLAISKLKKFCVKGKTFKSSASSKCPSGYKLVSFKSPTTVQWNSLSRNPAASANGNFLVFACIAQFDSVTGSSNFRAYAAKGEQTSYYSGVNSYFRGDKKQLLSYSEDDAVVVEVTVLGKYSYQTLGGGTSVPYFQVRDIKKVGTC